MITDASSLPFAQTTAVPATDTQSAVVLVDANARAQAQAAYSLDREVPVLGKSVVAIKVTPDRWVVRTPVVGGEPHDYTEYVMFDMGPYQGGGAIPHAWALHSIRASIGGVLNRYMEQDPTGPAVGTNEFATFIGTSSSDLTPASAGGTWDYYGFGHGNMGSLGGSIMQDGSSTSYTEAPVGTVLRCNSLTFDAAYAPRTAAGQVVGTCGVAHIFDSSGLRVAQQHTITAANVYCQNSYSAMLNSTGVDQVKPAGRAVMAIRRMDGSQSPSLGRVGVYAFYATPRPSNLLEVTLPYGGPVSGSLWSEDTTSDTFVANNTNGVSKFYCNWRSGNTPVKFQGQYNFLTSYRVRVGALV
jgi:hypothetical protein